MKSSSFTEITSTMIMLGSKGRRICGFRRYRLFRRSCRSERGGVYIEFASTSTRLLLLGIPLALGLGEEVDEAREDLRGSGGGVVLDPIGEELVTEIPGPLLVFGRSEGEDWVNARLLEAVEGRSVMVE
ncbi:hypothetical protein C7212DRAFT_361017 [Tuber magnatum]|uniref:Uncharacterized protein n=1 Tax=Tuber magnatum TaxID=42249 RepID=A0A317SZJ7_9PEZI|nr:hypothetical protein C7212DRAFT_361017 [Tuber magnatum]